jgi:hypothetical protein
MTTDEIRRRLLSLQDQINALASLLPDNAQLDFHAVDFTRPTDVAERKCLVVTITEIHPRASAALIHRVMRKSHK